jgi:hypothetical protein
VDEGLVLSPLLLLLLPLPVSVLLPPVPSVSVPPAPWLDGIIDGRGVLPLLSVPLSLLPLLLLSDVVGGEAGGVLLSLLSLSLLPLLLPSGTIDSGGTVVLPSLLSVVSSLDFEPVVLPALLLLSRTAIVGVDASGVDLSSDLCLFLVLLVSSEGAAGGGGHFPFTDKEPSGHGRDRGVAVLLSLLLALSVLLSLCLLLSLLLSVLVSSVAGGKGVRALLLALSVLLLSLMDGMVSLLFVASSGGIVAAGKGHFPFTDKEPSGHGRDRELKISLLPPSPLLLPSWLLEGVDVAVSGVDLSSDLFFFAAKTLWDTSNVKAIVVMEKTRIKMVNTVTVREFFIVSIVTVTANFVL